MAPSAITTSLLLAALFFAVASNAINVAEFVLYSDPPESLLPGQHLIYDMTPHGLPFGPHNLTFENCNLLLYNKGTLVWSTDTAHDDGKDCYLTVLPDGEVVLRRNFHYPIWSSGVKSEPGSYMLALTWDGILMVFGPELWTNTLDTVMSDTGPMMTTADYVQYSYQVTPASYGIILTFKNFQLVLTQECNLVLSDTNTGGVLWETKTSSPHHDCFTYLDEYGEFFIKHNRREILWRTGKRASQAAAYPKKHALALRYDGRLVIYHPQVWSSPPPAAPGINHEGSVGLVSDE